MLQYNFDISSCSKTVGLLKGFNSVWLYRATDALLRGASQIHSGRLSQSWKGEWRCICKWTIRGVFLLSSLLLWLLSVETRTFSLFFFCSCFLSGYLISIETVPGCIVVISGPDSLLRGELCNTAPLICSHLTSLHYPQSRGGTIPTGAALHFHLDCFWLSYLTCFFSSRRGRADRAGVTQSLWRELLQDYICHCSVQIFHSQLEIKQRHF